MEKRAELIKFLEQRKLEPFVWGYSDCLASCMDWVKLISGNADFEKYKGRYSNRIEAAKLLRQSGYRTIENYLDKVLKPTDNPKEGDLALMWNRKVVGICGAFVAYFYDNGEILPVEFENCRKFYEVQNG